MRSFIRFGRQYYRLTNPDLAAEMGVDVRTITNLLTAGSKDKPRPLLIRNAKKLLRAVLYSAKARAWREEHGCCEEHRTGDAIYCLRRSKDGLIDPCDRWHATLMDDFIIRKPWLFPRLDQPPEALVPASAIDDFAREAAQSIFEGREKGLSLQDQVERGLRRFLNKRGTAMAYAAAGRMSNELLGFVKDCQSGKIRCTRRIGDQEQHLLDLPLTDLVQHLVYSAPFRLGWKDSPHSGFRNFEDIFEEQP